MNETINIYIPSYNRPDQCLETLRKLVPQINLNENIKIYVLDNCSDINYQEYFLKTNDISKYINQDKLKIKRNNLNIGMSANIMRCFEYSVVEKGWLWILSDDDYINDNAIEIIQDSVNHCEKEVGFVKFSSNRLKHPNGIIIESPKKLIDFISDDPKVRFNSYIFLTNLVYRIEAFKGAVSNAYDFTLTHVPHFILLNLSLKNDFYIKHDSSQLATYKRPKLGYSYGLFAGIQVGSIKPLIIKGVSLRDFRYIFQVHNDAKVAVDLYYELLSKKSLDKFKTYLFIYLSNLFFSKCYLRSILFIPIVIVLTTRPLRKLLIFILSNSRYSSEIVEIKNRYNLSR